MDPRYPWAPQPYGNGNAQYVPPPPQQGNGNSYPPSTYPVQYQSQEYPQQYQASPTPQYQGQSRVVIPPRSNLPYTATQVDLRHQPRFSQPQVVIPPRNNATNVNPLGGMLNQNQRIRQVMMTVQKPAQGLGGSQHRSSPHTPSSQTPVQYRTPSSSSQNRPPQASSSQNRHQQVVIKRSPNTTPQGQLRPPHTPSKALPTDLSVLLLHAADEYINAARLMGPVAAMAKEKDADSKQYYKLMSTGLGCMEAVLKRYTQIPRDEAKLRLRYASLLIEETENHLDIEEVLSRGISLCSRSRLLDLKYSMQHLQARYQFRSNHRAAMKSLDGPISEAETFQHMVWVYAFRFLKASLAMQVPGRPEMASALQQLHAISNHAEKRGDRAIYVTASALEAMIHLRTSGQDHLEPAQRAIAAARSYQLQVDSKEIGQIAALIDAIDIACSLQKGQPDKEKMDALQKKADHDPGPVDGVFSVLIEKSFGGLGLTQNTGGIFTKATDGRDQLVFTWLPANNFQTLAYYLSGLTSATGNVTKGQSYLREGLRITKDSLQRPASFPISIPTSIKQRTWVMVLDWHLRFTLGLMGCRVDEQKEANQHLTSLRKLAEGYPFKDEETFTRLTSYLTGVVAQSSGSLDEAVATYTLPTFSVLSPNTPHDATKTDISIIATLNLLLILRNPSHPSHHLVPTLLHSLEPLCLNHPNRTIQAAFSVLRALTHINTAGEMHRQKTLMMNAVTASQKLTNYPFLAICLNYMAYRFWGDSVGDQAVKSVRAARSVARKEKLALWRVVSCGLCIGAFERNGLTEDARECRQAFGELVRQLPRGVAEGMGLVVGVGEDVEMEG